MHSNDQQFDQQLVARIHASRTPSVIAITGGGSSAIGALLEVPGASATVLEAVVPYSHAALADWLGGEPDGACSQQTARAMAMAAYERARQLTNADPHTLRGIGATASLATTRPKRGAHRVHVAWQSAERTVALSCELSKGERTRAAEEAIAAGLVMQAVVEACGLEATVIDPAVTNDVERREAVAPAEWMQLLLGQRAAVIIGAVDSPAVLFPGAFDPLHAGHRRMIEVAAERCGAPVTLELSMANVDKRPLDFVEIEDRLVQCGEFGVLLTRAATFVEKSQLAPGATFLVGADTMMRIGEPRYYGDDASRRDTAIAAIAAAGCRFLVFGRTIAGRFTTLDQLKLPTALGEICDEVTADEFREDISSTELRAAEDD